MNNLKNLDVELNLREFWSILMKGKLIILIITFLATVSAVSYAIKAIPIYNGNVLVEIGEVENSLGINNNQMIAVFNLDNVYTLKEIVGRTTGVNPTIIGGVTNMLQLSYEGSDKDEIRSKLVKAVDSIIERHQEKAKFYQNDHTKIRMTRIIGKIAINEQPIKPNKRIIIVAGFISGLMLGIFIVFLRVFYTNKREYFHVERA